MWRGWGWCDLCEGGWSDLFGRGLGDLWGVAVGGGGDVL